MSAPDPLNGQRWQVLTGDCLECMESIPSDSVDSCVTSPPYFNLRDYGHPDQIGLEETPEAYIAKMVAVFAEVRRILKPSGVCWLNIGDSYAGSTMTGGNNSLNAEGGESGFKQARQFVPCYTTDVPAKNLLGIPWRIAFAFQADGWYLRDAVIWHKPNPMPESVTDRCTKSYETVFMLTKSDRYFFDAEAIAEPFADDRMGASGAKSLPYSDGSGRNDTLSDGDKAGLGITPARGFRNRRNVWTIPTKPCKEAHFAVMPPELARLCIVSATPHGGIVFDPFTGAGTTGMVAGREGRQFIGTELNPDYAAIARRRIADAYAQGKLDFGGEQC